MAGDEGRGPARTDRPRAGDWQDEARRLPPSGAGGPLLAAHDLALAALIFVAAMILQATRLGWNLDRTLWAEDGRVFLQDSLSQPFAAVVTKPHGGYMHLVPRVVAALSTHISLTAASSVALASSLIGVGSVAAFVYLATSWLISSRGVRLFLATSIPLLPVGQQEAFATTANLHFFLMFAAFWALLSRPRSSPGTAVTCLVVAVSALCDPLTLLLLPVGIVRGILTGWRQVRWTMWTMILAGAVQLVAVRAGRVGRPFPVQASPAALAVGFLTNVMARALVGSRFATEVDAASILLGLLALVCLSVLAWTCWRFRRRPADIGVAAGMVAMSGLAFATPAYLTATAPPRYSVLPVLLFYSAVAILIDRLVRALGRDARARTIAAAAGAVFVVIAILNGPITMPSPGNPEGGALQWPGAQRGIPKWREALRIAASECSALSDHVRVKISPPGWSMGVPCERLVTATSVR